MNKPRIGYLAILLVGSLVLSGCSEKSYTTEQAQDREVCKVLAQTNKDYKAAFESEAVEFREQKIRTIERLPGFLAPKVLEYVLAVRKSGKSGESASGFGAYANQNLYEPIKKTCLKLDIKIQALYEW